MPSELPEGDGITGEYPGDLGIEEHPAVVFADGFEDIEDDTMATGFEKQKGKKWDGVWGTLRVTREPENVHTGRQAVEIRHPRAGSRGAGKHFEKGLDTLYVRYYMKYAKEFPGCHHTGINILGGAPGVTVGSATAV